MNISSEREALLKGLYIITFIVSPVGAVAWVLGYLRDLNRGINPSFVILMLLESMSIGGLIISTYMLRSQYGWFLGRKKD
jgi:hypothetical protein